MKYDTINVRIHETNKQKREKEMAYIYCEEPLVEKNAVHKSYDG